MAISEHLNVGGTTALEISRRHLKGAGPINLGLAQEYLHAPHNPEVITAVWSSFLPDVSVPRCKWKEADIARPMVRNKR